MDTSIGTANRQIARGAGPVMAAFALNNIVGLARQMIVLNAFGTSGEMDAFIAANRVSETLFTLVAGGALASAFIPTFTSLLVKDDQRGAWKLASAIANLILLILTLAALLARESCIRLTDSSKKHKAMDEMFEDKIADARYSGSIEDDLEAVSANDWITERV